jgi:hypothetical protein
VLPELHEPAVDLRTCLQRPAVINCYERLAHVPDKACPGLDHKRVHARLRRAMDGHRFSERDMRQFTNLERIPVNPTGMRSSWPLLLHATCV